MKRKFTVIIFLFSTIVLSAQKTPAFPTAEGYGKWASGGRGGIVVEVTNTKDYDPTVESPVEGSLRWALSTQGKDSTKNRFGQWEYFYRPITIVFRTSGIIDLQGRDLRIKRSNFTIAGQTAPGDGICIKGGNVNFGEGRNIIIRHIRSRLGLLDDGGFIAGAAMSIENGGQFIIDHCSFSWSAEENIGFYDNDSTTVQWCLIAEGLYDAGHGKGARGYGAVVGGRSATYHHNLIAHNVSRAPRFGATTKNDVEMLMDYVNNVHYNWGGSNSFYGGDNRQGTKGKFQANLVNNYYKPGPAYPGTNRTKLVRASFWTGVSAPPQQGRDESLWHLSGNYMEGTANTSINADNYAGLDFDDYKPYFPDITVNDLKKDRFEVPYPVETQTAQASYESVLEKAGAFPRDGFDERVIRETKEGTAAAISSFKAYAVTGIVDKPADSGGYPEYNAYNYVTDTDKDGIPDYWETANDMDPEDPKDGNLTSSEGYTYLEVYLNGLAGEYIPGFNYPAPVYETSIKATLHKEELLVYSENSGNTLKIESSEPISSIIIHNIPGNTVCNFAGVNISEVNIASLSKGIHILQCVTESGTVKRIKFLK